MKSNIARDIFAALFLTILAVSLFCFLVFYQKSGVLRIEAVYLCDIVLGCIYGWTISCIVKSGARQIKKLRG